ncbi:polysaccharide deacetylase family protein [Pseudoduganella sp. OTU4001]|uniref:polysaccharide deacetylase family protein n=1 Tax=Pseudoduganella sp. OTU4001 TaxID=3043854 RepID=UPI00313E42DF
MNPAAPARTAPLAVLALAALALGAEAAAGPQCRGTIYLTFDTGSQSQAGLIATVLKRQGVKATFFLANEKTVNGDYSLDQAWAGYWRERAAEGHAFGSHTFDHTYYVRDAANGKITVKPQFGPHAGRTQDWTPQQYCAELQRVDRRFEQMTGARLDPFWRAPGGKTSPRTLQAGKACGYQHAGWATPAGFSGDELPVERASNAALLRRALDGLRDGDIFMAHMGIWSRKDPWAPANLEPLIEGLKQKGFCFATLREHPDYKK